MKSFKHSLHYRPFEDVNLNRLVPEPPSQKRDVSEDSRPERSPDPETETALFRKEMETVVPIDRSRTVPVLPRRPDGRGQAGDAPDRDEDAAPLWNLVRRGEGFVVNQTPEYMEGALYRAPPDMTERLHRGDFSVQDYIDLHGLTVDEARTALDEFFVRSHARGVRTVLIVHGRGRSSPVQPVLKSMVREWLTTGPRRAWVIAFSSARLCDGGAGATYVLFRHRPLGRGKRRGAGRRSC